MNASCDETRQWRAALLAGAAELGLTISQAQIATLCKHFGLLLAHNRRAGLTTITHPAEIAIKHFLDSLTGLLAREILPGERVVDVGSGGGFPGAALAVARPSAQYTLVESSRKRAAFLELLVRELRLSNAVVLTARAEDAGSRPEHREAYDLVLSRAVALLPVLLEYCLPLARVGGQMLAYKGPEAEAEVGASGPALEALGGSVRELRQLSLPQQMGERTLVLVDKVAPTRRPGTPTRRPL